MTCDTLVTRAEFLAAISELNQKFDSIGSRLEQLVTSGDNNNNQINSIMGTLGLGAGMVGMTTGGFPGQGALYAFKDQTMRNFSTLEQQVAAQNNQLQQLQGKTSWLSSVFERLGIYTSVAGIGLTTGHIYATGIQFDELDRRTQGYEKEFIGIHSEINVMKQQVAGYNQWIQTTQATVSNLYANQNDIIARSNSRVNQANLAIQSTNNQLRESNQSSIDLVNRVKGIETEFNSKIQELNSKINGLSQTVHPVVQQVKTIEKTIEIRTEKPVELIKNQQTQQVTKLEQTQQVVNDNSGEIAVLKAVIQQDEARIGAIEGLVNEAMSRVKMLSSFINKVNEVLSSDKIDTKTKRTIDEAIKGLEISQAAKQTLQLSDVSAQLLKKVKVLQSDNTQQVTQQIDTVKAEITSAWNKSLNEYTINLGSKIETNTQQIKTLKSEVNNMITPGDLKQNNTILAGEVLAGATLLLNPLKQQVEQINNQTTPDVIKQSVSEASPKSPCLAPVYVPPVAAQVAGVQATTTTIAATTGVISNVQLASVLTKLGPDLVGGISGFLTGKFTALWNSKIIDRALNFMILSSTLVNTAMLTTSVAQTLMQVLNNILQTIGLKDPDGVTKEFSDAIGHTVEAFLIGVLGSENYTSLGNTWKSLNRILTTGANLLNAITNTLAGIQQGLEVVGRYQSSIGNALIKFGVVGEKAYNWMSEKINFRGNRTGAIIGAIENGLQNATNVASDIEQVSSAALTTKQNFDQIKEAKTDFDKSISDSEKAKKDKESADKATSAAPTIAQTDLIKPSPTE